MSRSLPATLSYVKIRELGKSDVPSESALVVGLAQGKEAAEAVKGVRAVKELSALFTTISKSGGFKGKGGQTLTLLHQREVGHYEHAVALGLGKSEDAFAQNFLHWGGRLAQELKHHRLRKADVFIDSLLNLAPSADASEAPRDYAGRPLAAGLPSREEAVEKFATGFLLALYTFDRYKTEKGKAPKKDPKELTIELRLISQTFDGRRMAEIIEKVQILVEASYLVRDLQNTPGNDMVPAEIARRAQQAGREAGFNVTVWDEKKLKTEGMNGILTVGKGSENPPRFIIMEHNASKKNLPHVVLVGKGISFDAGGISIKPSQGMEEMKYDMSGSANVIGALYALARLKAPVRVTGLVSSAENMPSGTAVKPGDIYTAYDGQTVEVLNTDAEGRLVLADALAYAKSLKPDCVIDNATLTGACVLALGAYASGLMGNNGELIEGFKRASERSGERVWELPLYHEYGDELKSKVADYRNVNWERGGGAQKGGCFLQFFVQDAYPWIHLDIAATADTPRGQGAHCPPDSGTAVPMRSLVEFAANVSEYFSKKKR